VVASALVPDVSQIRMVTSMSVSVSFSAAVTGTSVHTGLSTLRVPRYCLSVRPVEVITSGSPAAAEAGLAPATVNDAIINDPATAAIAAERLLPMTFIPRADSSTGQRTPDDQRSSRDGPG
jgi:hypothetical protein